MSKPRPTFRSPSCGSLKASATKERGLLKAYKPDKTHGQTAVMKQLIVLVITAGVILSFPVLTKGNGGAEIISKSEELLDLGKVEEAHALLEKGVIDYPKSAALHEKLGALYFEIYKASEKKPKEEDIFSRYEKAVELDPDNDAFLSRLGYLYYWFGEWDKSEKACKRSIEINPNNIDAWRALGLTYCAFRNENEKGEKVYKKMIELFPNKAVGYLRLGVLSGKRGKPAEALLMYLKAVDVEPANLYAIYLLFVFFNDQDWKEAREAIARLGIKAKPDNTLDMQECYYKGEFYKHLETMDKAEKLYQMSLKKYSRKDSYRESIEYELNSLQWEKEYNEMRRKRLAEFEEQTDSMPENPASKQRREILAHEREEILRIWNDWKKKQNI